MYLSPIGYHSQVFANNKSNSISMKAKKIPYCLDTRIYDTFVKRLENLKDIDVSEQTKVFMDKNFRVLSGSNVEAIVNELKLPVFKINVQDFLDKKTNIEHVNVGDYYMRKVVNQLKFKFMNTGERSILLFEDADKILGQERDINTLSKRARILDIVDKAKSNGIIPVLTTKNTDYFDSSFLNRFRMCSSRM